MVLDIIGLSLGMIIRFFLILLAFGLVYVIDKLTHYDNQWDLKYVLTISLFATIFMTVMELLTELI